MNEAQKCLYLIAENMRMDKSISKEGYEYFQQATKALEQEPTTKNNLAVDCISRQAVLNFKQTFHDNAGYETEYVDIEDIKALPSVYPARPKGKWMEYCYQNFNCSKCGYIVADDDVEEYKFCPNCGADMRGEENG